MADATPTTFSEPSTPPSSAAEQARIRKERREAKIKAGGSARLNKITGLGGGVQRDALPQTTTPTPNNPSHAPDPEEVDISEHFYQPASRARPRIPPQDQDPMQISDDQLRAMMLGLPPSRATPPSANPPGGFPREDGTRAGLGACARASDADGGMLKVLQQITDSVLGDGVPGTSTPGQQGPREPALLIGDRYAHLWRIVHAVFALGLGLYIALATAFTGSKRERDLSVLTKAAGVGGDTTSFFYMFATGEVLLQTSRFLLEKGRVQHGGLLGTIIDFLPEPWKGYLVLVARYGRIWTTTSADAMVCVFVLGVCSWVRTS